jgi:hypothetical protein
MAYRYAQKTKVPANQTRSEIETLLTKNGATGFIYGATADTAMIGFEMQGWRLRFMLPLPPQKRNTTENQIAAETRRRWRALLLVIKAKLEAVASGIVEFQREFLPFIVVRGNETVGDQILPNLGATLSEGKLPPLLGAGS